MFHFCKDFLFVCQPKVAKASFWHKFDRNSALTSISHIFSAFFFEITGFSEIKLIKKRLWLSVLSLKMCFLSLLLSTLTSSYRFRLNKTLESYKT
jgi:hypothetical protein